MLDYPVPTRAPLLHKRNGAYVLYSTQCTFSAVCAPSVAGIAVSESLCLEHPECPRGEINVWQL